MNLQALSVSDYLAKVPPGRQDDFNSLRQAMLQHIPAGFQEVLSYGMIGYVVPHTLYAPGYHCDPKLPLPFASIAVQKNSINLYHMGLYASPGLLDWFTAAYAHACSKKLDMGKSCIRFKNKESMPLGLIGELMTKLTPEAWIHLYETNLKGPRA
ncbi:MAG: DUF1801 domain-containing protein [Bacteroidetes bacterium]|jgi:hypothetical protein|nr:DUF1801 domain-containing protein [Bacteroidota bacterium]